MTKELEKGIFDLVLLDRLVGKGKLQWEITVKSMQFPDNFLVGVCSPGIDPEANPLESGMFWGFQPLV